MNKENEVWCWEDGPAGDSTCTLTAGHTGNHWFTPDDQITVTFGPANISVNEIVNEMAEEE